MPGLFTTCAGVVYLRFAPRLSRPDEDQAAADAEMGSDLTQPLDPAGAANAGGLPMSPSRLKREGSERLPKASGTARHRFRLVKRD